MRWFFLLFCIAPGLSTAAPGCIQAFDGFLARFEANRAFQEENIIYPLKRSFVDAGADPEPKVVDKPLSKSDVKEGAAPVFPSKADQTKVPFEEVIKTPALDRRTVQLQKPDTGNLLIYRFQKIGECWKLVEFEDASI
ncbi:MAG: hypothetical protein M0R77_11750 [Gammaproteobacteria bacterium]|nr:hypothetical protein [Gammaproteobacteria bacterium]